VKKLREVFFLQPMLNKKPLSDFKNPSPFSQNPSRKSTGQNWQKTVFEFFWVSGFAGESGFGRTP
jgi:hypothetical protein